MKKLQFALQDIDGFTVDSTTYKLAKGAKMQIYVSRYPTMSIEMKANVETKPAIPLSEGTTYLSKIGPTESSGFNRPKLTLEVLLPVDENVFSRDVYFDSSDSTLDTTSIIDFNYYLLWNLMMANHTLYLTDMKDSLSNPNWGLPINILLNRNDMFDNQIFDSTKGIPITLVNIEGSKDVRLKDDDKTDGWIPLKLTFVVDGI